VAPLIVLVVVTVLARLSGQVGVRALRTWTACIRVGLAVMFCFTAAAHFNSMRGDLVRMMPPGGAGLVDGADSRPTTNARVRRAVRTIAVK
jgi:hypothetical protein